LFKYGLSSPFGYNGAGQEEVPGMKSSIAAAILILMTSAAGAVTIDTVPVGNPSNAADIQPQGLFGRVTTSYRIGVTEVTNAQYVEFLNAKAATDPFELYHPSMDATVRGGITRSGSSGSYTYAVKASVPGEGPNGTTYTYGDKPVGYVSWFDAARFANWLHNGQGNGATETGAYALTGGTPIPSNGGTVTRQAGATWFLPTENEWYKAAYYDGTAAQYRDYPTNTDTEPNNNLPLDDTGNSANFYQAGSMTTGDPDYPYTPAGAYDASDSAYGTLDQGGSVWEWTETIISAISRVRRGGAFDQEAETLSAAHRGSTNPSFEIAQTGFRLATIPTAAPVPGDYNTNGTVDAADYVLWRNGGPLANEVSEPGTVNQQDYVEWRARFGNTAGTGSGLGGAEVPEPSVLTCVLFAGLGAIGAHRKRRCQ
jgi:formylglycine-generating enzyme required for sulfatase activity